MNKNVNNVTSIGHKVLLSDIGQPNIALGYNALSSKRMKIKGE